MLLLWAHLCCEGVVGVLYGCGVEHDLNHLLGKLTHAGVGHVTLERVWLAPPVDQLPERQAESGRAAGSSCHGVCKTHSGKHGVRGVVVKPVKCREEWRRQFACTA